jgi:hypothetical protein
MARLQSDLAGLMHEVDAVLASPPAPLPTQLDSRRQQIEALTAAITATTATLRAHSAAAAASSAVLERERRLVAAETALMATQVGVVLAREGVALGAGVQLSGGSTKCTPMFCQFVYVPILISHPCTLLHVWFVLSCNAALALLTDSVRHGLQAAMPYSAHVACVVLACRLLC